MLDSDLNVNLWLCNCCSLKCHGCRHCLHTYASLYDKTKARFGIYPSRQSFWYIICHGLTKGSFTNLDHWTTSFDSKKKDAHGISARLGSVISVVTKGNVIFVWI